LRQPGFRLWQPEVHVHAAVQVDGSEQCGPSRHRSPSLAVESAKAVLAVRLEWAHARFLGQDEGLVVACFGFCSLYGLALCRNVAEAPQCPGLLPTFSAATREVKSLPRDSTGVSKVVSQEQGFTEMEIRQGPQVGGPRQKEWFE
jgi:hypothetical protein